MATKILSNTKEFNPVKIEIEFVTRSQLAAFIAVMFNPPTVANAIDDDMVNAYSDKGNSMSFREMHDAINSLIELEELEELVKLVDN